MLRTDLPIKIPIPWASQADPAYVREIPNPSQVATDPAAASFATGYPPNTFVPTAAGGSPPYGKDENGAFRRVTQWLRWHQTGVAMQYDSDFANGIGGYPAGAVLESKIVTGKLWYNTTDGNYGDPDAFAAGWICHPLGPKTGQPIPRVSGENAPDCVFANGGYIGNTATGAPNAGPDMVFLYVWLWNNFPNTICPVNGGRGANALADFNAAKAMATLNMVGNAFVGMDEGGSSYLTGVPVVVGGSGTPGSILGETFHRLLLAEIPPTVPAGVVSISDPGHYHISATAAVKNSQTQGTGGGTWAGGNSVTLDQTTTTAATNISASFSGSSNGGGNGLHNNVQRSFLGRWMLKK